MLGILHQSEALFYASAFFRPDGVPTSAPAQVPCVEHTGLTQTVGRPLSDGVGAEPKTGKVLVGHSMGGSMVVTQVAEYKARKIQTLVYLTARLLHNGEPSLSAGQGDPKSLLGPNLVFTSDRSSVTVREEALKDVFYGDCSDEDVALARALLVLEAVASLAPPSIRVKRTSGGSRGSILSVCVTRCFLRWCRKSSTRPCRVRR